MLTTAPFGATGHHSTRLIFGGAALGEMSQARADATLAIVRERGINHIDTAASYGESELRLTDFLADHRAELFLATKTEERSGAAARSQLEASLDRMGVDHVDLIQLHNLVEDDEWSTAFGPQGAVAALFAARDEGLCRHVGVTGHGLRIPRMHLRSLEAAPFASVLFPWNHVLATNDDYAADVAALRAHCLATDVAMQTIKSLARRRWTDLDQRQFSWYEPLTDRDAIARAVAFVLADASYFLNTSSDARLLEATIDAAAAFDGHSPDAAALAADREAYGMTPLFDGGALERI
jgi:aryl-alcohol dehydrogenase-like predicted oxidoreductase